MNNLESLSNKELMQLYNIILEHQQFLKTEDEKVEKEEEK